jgi:hypothetical protein
MREGEGRPVKSDELDLYAYKYKRLLQLKEKPLKPEPASACRWL